VGNRIISVRGLEPEADLKKNWELVTPGARKFQPFGGFITQPENAYKL
jgi:hypothetical protein